jgi:hypothetical protein
MAKKRYINTRFWSDNYISGLDPSEKLLFIYLLTNPFTDICGVYEISIKQIALDTGLDGQEMIPKIIGRFSRDNKIHYIDGWVVIKNFIKHQGDSPQVKKGIDRSLKDVPDYILDKISKKDIEYPYSISTVSHLNSNLDLNLNLSEQTTVCGEELVYEEENPAKNQTLNKQIFALMERFRGYNPGIKIGHKTHRKACEELINLKGYDLAKQTVDYALAVQGRKFAPTITTPTQLINKMGDLRTYGERQKNNNSMTII